jgi:hypothetical protein
VRSTRLGTGTRQPLPAKRLHANNSPDHVSVYVGVANGY